MWCLKRKEGNSQAEFASALCPVTRPCWLVSDLLGPSLLPGWRLWGPDPLRWHTGIESIDIRSGPGQCLTRSTKSSDCKTIVIRKCDNAKLTFGCFGFRISNLRFTLWQWDFQIKHSQHRDVGRRAKWVWGIGIWGAWASHRWFTTALGGHSGII